MMFSFDLDLPLEPLMNGFEVARPIEPSHELAEELDAILFCGPVVGGRLCGCNERGLLEGWSVARGGLGTEPGGGGSPRNARSTSFPLPLFVEKFDDVGVSSSLTTSSTVVLRFLPFIPYLEGGLEVDRLASGLGGGSDIALELDGVVATTGLALARLPNRQFRADVGEVGRRTGSGVSGGRYGAPALLSEAYI